MVFINAFYQLRSTDALAKALVHGARPAGRARAQPRRLPDARRQPAGLAARSSRTPAVFYSPSLREATDKVLALSRAAASGQAA